MKRIPFLFLSLIMLIITVECMNKNSHNGSVKNSENSLNNNKKNKLNINLSPDKILKFKSTGWVYYSDFGAKGDGKTDDIQAIARTHTFANQHNLLVKANDSANYYIGGKALTVIIQTNTDFGSANFIIDDTNLQNYEASIFTVSSNLKPFKLEGIQSLKRNQQKLEVLLPEDCMVSVTNSNIKHYIRLGLNPTDGSPMRDTFMVDKNGNINKDTPVIWDFNEITNIDALPIDQTELKITGGHFTTIANKAESKYNYHNRNIKIRRSNVLVDGIKHDIVGEGKQSAPYGGFINVKNSSFVTIKNAVFTGHKTYETIGRADKPVSMGTYDIILNNSLNVSLINCSQTNDINDTNYWGLMGSNYCKNIVLDTCVFSRFDAHKGVANAIIRNSTLGHMGINAIGSGTFLVENTTVRGKSFINLRSDYGSTWQGEIIIRNCIFEPIKVNSKGASLIKGAYTGQHDFGYTCYMPEKITLENFYIDDSNQPDNYKSTTIFADFNKNLTDKSYIEKFPYVKTKEVILKNVTTESGKKMRLSNNPFMFKNVKIITSL